MSQPGLISESRSICPVQSCSVLFRLVSCSPAFGVIASARLPSMLHLCTWLHAGLLWSRAFSNTRSYSSAPPSSSCCRELPAAAWLPLVCAAASLKNLMACSVHLASCCGTAGAAQQSAQHQPALDATRQSSSSGCLMTNHNATGKNL